MAQGKRQIGHSAYCGLMCSEWTFGNCWLSPREVTQFFNGEDFSEIFKGRIRSNYAGCSKSSSSKAAASEGPEAYPLGYVEDLNDARTTLAGFFSIPLQQIADQLHRLFRRGCGIHKMRCETFEETHPVLVGSQQNDDPLGLQR